MLTGIIYRLATLHKLKRICATQVIGAGLISLQNEFGTQKNADSKRKISAFHLPWYGLSRTVPGSA